MKIGSFDTHTRAILAPLAGCSDLPFRLIAREHGARLCFFEMVDAHSLVRKSRKTPHILATTKDDVPIAGQLLGNDPATTLEASKILTDLVNIAFLDINAACPVPKVIKKKAGAFFLKEPPSLYRTLELLSSSLKIPVTVKMRIGFEKRDPARAKAIARHCESAGAAAIFVHGRTRDQGYSGDVDYASIRLIKESVAIPVIGSGNILSVHDAQSMVSLTGCDGVLVARGGFGNPWLCRDIDAFLSKGTLPVKKTIRSVQGTLSRHLDYIHDLLHNTGSVKKGIMCKVASWYLKGMPGACRLRAAIFRASDASSARKIIDAYFEEISDDKIETPLHTARGNV